jgi:hypothetical protein
MLVRLSLSFISRFRRKAHLLFSSSTLGKQASSRFLSHSVQFPNQTSSLARSQFVPSFCQACTIRHPSRSDHLDHASLCLGPFFYEMLMIVDVDAAVGHSFIESQTDHYRYRSDFSEFGLKGHKEIHCIGPKSHFCSLQCGTIRKPLGQVAGMLEEKKYIVSVLNRTFAPYSVEPSLP